MPLYHLLSIERLYHKTIKIESKGKLNPATFYYVHFFSCQGTIPHIQDTILSRVQSVLMADVQAAMMLAQYLKTIASLEVLKSLTFFLLRYIFTSLFIRAYFQM